MGTLVEIDEKTPQGRQYLKIFRISPDFARIIKKSEGVNPRTIEAIKEASEGKGKRYSSVKSLIKDLKKG